MKVLALHGWGGNGTDSSTINRVREHFEAKGIEVITPTYDYTNPDKAAKTIMDATGGDDYLFIVGMSFGGFWARWLANELKASTLFLLNPALDAYTSTEKYLGDFLDYKTGITRFYANAQRKKLKKYHIDKDHPELPITAIVAKDDDVVCPTTVEKEVGSDRCDLKYVTGGHRLEDPSQYLDHLEFAYNTLHM
jgi:predicted esterase YcpF (UPF0227 family)